MTAFRWWGLIVLTGMIPSCLTASLSHSWWLRLNDPIINQAVPRLMGINPDWRAYEADVTQAKAETTVPRAMQWPSIELTAGASRTNIRDFPFKETSFGQIGAQLKWDWDWFGKTSNQVKRADALLNAKNAEKQEGQLKLVAELANAVVTARETMGVIHHMKLELTARETQETLTQSLVKVGLADPSLLHHLSITTDQLRSNLAQMEALSQATQYELIQLLDAPDIWNELNSMDEYGVPTLNLEPELTEPIEALNNRPDVQISKSVWEGMVAKLGEANAAYWPSIGVSGSYGSFHLLDTGDRINGWSANLDVTYPLFTFGRITAQATAAKAGATASQLRYESTVKKGVRKMMTSLKQLLASHTIEERGRSILDSQRQLLRLHEMKFASGLIDFGTLCDTQANYHAGYALSIRQRAAVAKAMIQYQVELGGMSKWNPSLPGEP